MAEDVQPVKIYDISSPEPTLGTIHPNEVDQAISSGKFSFPKGQPVQVVNPQGELGTIDPAEAPKAFQAGYKFATPEIQKGIKFGSGLERVKAGAEGFAEGVAGPLAPMIERTAGVKPEDIRARAEANPGTHMIGQAVGLGAGMFTGVGEGALLEAAGKGAVEGFGLGGAGALEKVGAHTVRTATEMATLSASDETSKMILNDPDQSLQTAITDIGLSGLIGAGGGAALGSVSPLWKASVGDRAAQFAEDFKGRWVERVANPDPLSGVTDELTNYHKSITGLADDVYGAKGLKAQEISSLIPEMNDKIVSQAGDIASKLESSLAEMRSRPNLYPERLVSRLENDLSVFKRGVFQAPKAETAFDFPNEKYAVTRGNVTELMDELPKKYEQRLKNKVSVDKIPVFKEPMPGDAVFPDQMETKIQLPVGGNTRSPGEIFNAIQDLKQNLQGYSKFDKFVKPVDEGYDFVKKIKGLAHDTRTALEDTKTWGRAAERQNSINKAFKEFMPALGDFEKKFTTEILGERTVDPAKINTYMNQLGKPNAELKQEMLGNFLKAAEKYRGVINETHANLGIESPFQHSSLQAASQTLKKLPPGAKAADVFFDKALSGVAGKGLGSLMGAGAGAALGHPWLGAIVGEHALGKFFSTMLPSIIKPLMDRTANGEGFKAAIDYMAAVSKGNTVIQKATKALFKPGGEIVAPKMLLSDKERDRLDKNLHAYQLNPSALENVGGKTAYYLPHHAQTLGETSGRVVQYLNTLRPHSEKMSPLDSSVQPSKVEMSEYHRALQIAEQPLVVMDSIKNGSITPHDVLHLKNMYPSLYNKMAMDIHHEISEQVGKGQNIPYKLRLGMSLFLGEPLDSSMTPQSIQTTQQALMNAPQPQQPMGQQQPKGSLNSLNKMNQMYQTPQQSRIAQKGDH